MKGLTASLAFLLPVFLLIGGCGGSSGPATSTTSTTSPSTTTATVSTTTTGTETKPATVVVVGEQPPRHRHRRTQIPAATNVRIPAKFTIAAGDRMTPASVAVPASVAIEFTVVSSDHQPHNVVLETPRKHSLSVPPGGRVSILIPGLRPGQYPVELDGKVRATLITGAAPGP